MLENYLNIITNMENYVDGILVVDANADIVYMHKFNEELSGRTFSPSTLP